MSQIGLAHRFIYHPPNEKQIEKYKTIREQCACLAADLEMLCPESRELSLAITKLEEVVYWANASIARNE